MNITNIRDTSGCLFEFNHSELTVDDLYLSEIECSIFAFSDSAATISDLSLSNLNVSSVAVNSNSNLAISNSSFHSIEVQVLVSADILSNVTIEGSKFSMIYADSILNLTDSTFSLTLSYFNNLSLKHFISLTSSSASLSNSSIVNVKSSQSLVKIDDSVVTVKLIEVEDVVLESFVDLSDSTLNLINANFISNITLFNSFSIGHLAELVFRNLIFFDLTTVNDFPLINLSNSIFNGDLVSFELLNCTLFEFISTEVQFSNTSFKSINSPSIGFIADSSLTVCSSVFPMSQMLILI
ncbi:hypothetical protein GEMRC1_009255 [Eukaryota sp. GEM-RC1]